MRNPIAGMAATIALLATPAQAQHLSGPGYWTSVEKQQSTGVAIAATLRITLGPSDVVANDERVNLGLLAGPALSFHARDGVNRRDHRVAPLFSFDVRPGSGSRLRLGGQSLLSTGALHAEDTKEEDGQSTGEKIGSVAAVAGGVMVLVVGGWLIATATSDGNDE